MLANIGNVRAVQTARVKLNGQVEPMHQVTYTVGDQGPFSDAFTETDFTPENVQAAAAARIVKLHQIGVPLPHPPVEAPGAPGTWHIPIVSPPKFGDLRPAAPVPGSIYAHTEPVKLIK